MLVSTGDVNIDMLRPDKSEVKQYTEVLDSFNLKKMVTKPTTTTKSSRTHIDHFVTNLPKRITYTDVLPCPIISDHDAPYITINVRVSRCGPRYKYIRNDR